MTKWTLFITGLLIFISCSRPENKDRLSKSEWIYSGTNSKFLFDSLDIGLSFRGDSLFTSSDRGLFMRGQYLLDENKIKLHSDKDTIDYEVRITPDSLTIFRDNEVFKYYNKRLEFDPKLKYRRITLTTGQCLGGCQEFKVSLDNTGNVDFQRLKNGKTTEMRKYEMDKLTRDKVDSLFEASKISETDSAKFYAWFDDWDMTIKLEYGDNEVRNIKGTSSYMPYRLKPIIGTLINDLRKRAVIK